MKEMKKNNKGFTLLELLVVVLIIGILAAIPQPQYKKSDEKARMSEAVLLVRQIAEMHQLYYLVNGEYLRPNDIDKLDITIPGTKIQTGDRRLLTTYFLYSPNASGGSGDEWLAYAWRIKDNKESTNLNSNRIYSIYIEQSKPNKIICRCNSLCSNIQKALCRELNDNGTL